MSPIQDPLSPFEGTLFPPLAGAFVSRGQEALVSAALLRRAGPLSLALAGGPDPFPEHLGKPMQHGGGLFPGGVLSCEGVCEVHVYTYIYIYTCVYIRYMYMHIAVSVY